MYLIILFDICDKKRLRNVAKSLEAHGVRVQNSVFEVKTSKKKVKALQEQISAKLEGKDRVHYYQLCNKDLGARKADGLGQVMHIPNYVCITWLFYAINKSSE